MAPGIPGNISLLNMMLTQGDQEWCIVLELTMDKSFMLSTWIPGNISWIEF